MIAISQKPSSPKLTDLEKGTAAIEHKRQTVIVAVLPAHLQLQIGICGMQSNIQTGRGMLVRYKIIFGVSSRSHGERDQPRPVVLPWDRRKILSGLENQSALKGQQTAKVDNTEGPIKPFIFLLQVGALSCYGQKVFYALSFFNQQRPTTGIAFTAGQHPLRLINLSRDLFSSEVYRGAAK